MVSLIQPCGEQPTSGHGPLSLTLRALPIHHCGVTQEVKHDFRAPDSEGAKKQLHQLHRAISMFTTAWEHEIRLNSTRDLASAPFISPASLRNRWDLPHLHGVSCSPTLRLTLTSVSGMIGLLAFYKTVDVPQTKWIALRFFLDSFPTLVFTALFVAPYDQEPFRTGPRVCGKH